MSEALLEQRRTKFEQFLAERMPVLADFAERLELANPEMIVADPGSYLPAVGAFMVEQVVEPDDKNWIVARLGYLVGEVLIQRLSGCWFLNEMENSKNYGMYVVGQFPCCSNSAVNVDPVAVAIDFVEQAPTRDLVGLVAEVEEGIRSQ